MPHAVVEYSQDIETQFEAQALMQAVHMSLLSSAQFAEKDIKVRLYGCDHALVAGESATFIHITVYMLSGRSDETKKAITEHLLEVLKGLNLASASLSVDARDMDRSVYSKVTI